MIETATLALRYLLVPLALIVLRYCGSDALRFPGSAQNLPQTNRAGWALVATGTIISQAFFIAFPQPIVLLFGVLLFTVGMGFAAWLHRRAARKGTHLFEKMFARPDLAMPLVELHDIDPIQAAVMRDEILRLTAEAKVRGPHL